MKLRIGILVWVVLAVTSARAELPSESEPVRFGGKPVTFGFEAEFRGEAESRIFLKLGNPKKLEVDVERFPFLERFGDREWTGNAEVRSLGGEWKLSEVREQMTRVQKAVGEDLRSYHLHLFIPADAIRSENSAKIFGWLSFVADSIVAWRLQYQKEYLALQTSTVGRVSPLELDSRGTLRVQKRPNGSWDLEFRGFMRDVEKLLLTTREVLGRLQRPETISAHFAAYGNAFSRVDAVEVFRRHVGRELAQSEVALIRRIEENSELRWNLLPIYELDRFALISSQDGSRIRAATRAFCEDVLVLLQKHSRNEIADGWRGVLRMLRARAKLWAGEAKIHETLHRISMATTLEPETRIENPYLRHFKESLRDVTAAERALLRWSMQGAASNDDVLDVLEEVNRLGLDYGNPLMGFVRNFSPPLTDVQRIRVLRILENPINGWTLLSRLSYERDPAIVKAARKLSREVRPGWAREEVLRFLLSNEENEGLALLRKAAAQGGLSSVAEIVKTREDAATADWLRELSRKPDDRFTVVGILLRRKDARASALLVELYEKQPALRSTILKAFEREPAAVSSNEVMVRFAERLLQDHDHVAHGVGLLVHADRTDANEVLRKHFLSFSPEVRRRILKEWIPLSTEDLVFLESLLENRDEEAESILRSVARFSHPESYEFLDRALRSAESSSQRQRVIRYLPAFLDHPKLTDTLAREWERSADAGTRELIAEVKHALQAHQYRLSLDRYGTSRARCGYLIRGVR